jgi:simple sugar transport system permease protein
MTPLILSGLSAVVAFRAGMFSLGQAGQMVMGAALASSAASAAGVGLPAALIAGMAAGAIWGLGPALLRVWLGIPEILTTLIFNALAGIMAGSLAGWGYLDEGARFAPLAFNTKLNVGLFIALGMAAVIYLYLAQSVPGFEHRMAGQAPRFAAAAGIRSRAAVLRAMLISGALAGLAGAIEVIGVHYRFVGGFSGGDGFDGVAVAVLGHSHPAGVVIASLALAGLRLGATTGLQMHLNVPRELGNVVIAIALILVSIPHISLTPTRQGEGE